MEVIMERLVKHFGGKTSTCCPSCKILLIQHSDTIVSLPTNVEIIPSEHHNNIVRLTHKNCALEHVKSLHVCIGCGSKSTHSAKRLIGKHCKCKETVDFQEGQDGDADRIDVQIEECGFVNFEPENDYVVYAAPGDHCTEDAESAKVGTHEIASNNEIVNYFVDNDMWSDASRKYFVREHKKKGDGLRGLVFNALIDQQRTDDFSALSDNEMHHHLHIAKVYYGMSQSKSKDVCEMTRHTVAQLSTQKSLATQTMKEAFDESVREVLCQFTKSDHQIDSAMESMNDAIRKRVREYYQQMDQKYKIQNPSNYNEISKSYLKGANSIIQNLPMPKVGMSHGCAYIPAEEIINYLLALGLETKHYRAGFDDDWLQPNGKYECGYIKELHNRVKRILHEKPSIPKDTLVLLVRTWSDGFVAHHIKAHTDFNNMQLFTLTLRAPNGRSTKRHTLPFALCFKKENHHNIFIQLLHEISAMEEVKNRYFGHEKQLHPTMVFLELISADYPERCLNACISQNGTFTHRWGYSCELCEVDVPSCGECELYRMNNLLQDVHSDIANDGVECVDDGASMYTGNNCKKCLDWWSPHRHNVYKNVDVYPILPQGLPDQKKTPCVELSFGLIEKSILEVSNWHTAAKLDTNRDRKKFRDTSINYLKLSGMPPDIAKGIVADIMDGMEPSSSQFYPPIIKSHKQLNVKFKQFAVLPMHMCCLGIEKSLTSVTKMLVDRKIKIQNELWHGITKSIRESQKEINNASIDWCLAMPFSGKKDEIGTSNWQSDHYLSFTRMSLFHFGPLDGTIVIPKDKKRVFASFKRVRVIWFCLMASILTDKSKQVDVGRIDNLVKLFLSACRHYWALTRNEESCVAEIKCFCRFCNGLRKEEQELTNEKKRSGDEPITNKTKKKARKHSRGNKSRVTVDGTTRSNKEGQPTNVKPFYTTASNYMTLLNLKDTIQYFGSMRYLWEGLNEKYIQLVKRELKSMRHNDTFLMTVLHKLLCTSVFDLLNKDNPHCQEEKYSRTDSVVVYKLSLNHHNLTSVLQSKNVLIGVIDCFDNMFLCVHQLGLDAKYIHLYPLVFDDQNGQWFYNLWYSDVSIQTPTKKCKDREDLLNFSSDYFMLLRLNNPTAGSVSLRTVICRSWRVRAKNGDLILPYPTKDTLLCKGK